jgi:hypothetical protein
MSKEYVFGDFKEEKKSSNLACVDYTEKNGRVTIVGLRNFLTPDEILRKYGERVADIYVDSNVLWMENNPEYDCVGINIPGEKEMFEIRIGETLSKDSFLSVIETMKLAGSNLCTAIKKYGKKSSTKGVKSSEVKTITI